VVDRGERNGRTGGYHRSQHSSRTVVSTGTHEPGAGPGNRVKGLQGVREAAQRDKGLRFTTRCIM